MLLDVKLAQAQLLNAEVKLRLLELGLYPADYLHKEPDIDAMEAEIPAWGRIAVIEAFVETLVQGHPVTFGRDGFIIELSPDGTERVLGHLPARGTLSAGTKIKIT